MSNKREHHGMSRAAELLAGLGTTREIAAALAKSLGTVGDYRTGRRRPSSEVMAAIEARWPQVPVELWDAPPRAATGAQTPPEPRAEPSPLTRAGDDDDASEGVAASLEDNAAELHAMIRGDLARLQGAEGDLLELGKRSEVIRRLVAAQAALAKTAAPSELTTEQILASPDWQQLVATIIDALEPWPAAIWAIKHTLTALANGPESAEALDLRRRQIRACHAGDLARQAREMAAPEAGATRRS